MRTVDEWTREWAYIKAEPFNNKNRLQIFIEMIQKDAFYAGELKGLADGRNIIKEYGPTDEQIQRAVAIIKTLKDKHENT